jgi:hypothetical protein
MISDFAVVGSPVKFIGERYQHGFLFIRSSLQLVAYCCLGLVPPSATVRRTTLNGLLIEPHEEFVVKSNVDQITQRENPGCIPEVGNDIGPCTQAEQCSGINILGDRDGYPAPTPSTVACVPAALVESKGFITH